MSCYNSLYIAICFLAISAGFHRLAAISRPFLANVLYKNLSLIKIDVDGIEHLILKGASKTLKSEKIISPELDPGTLPKR